MTDLPVRSAGPTVEQFAKELLRCLEPSTIALMQHDVYTKWREHIAGNVLPLPLPFSFELCLFMDELTDIVDRAAKGD